MAQPGLDNFAMRLAEVVERGIAMIQHHPVLEPDPDVLALCTEFLDQDMALRQFLSRVVLYSKRQEPDLERTLSNYLGEYARGLRLQYLAQRDK